ncbi:alpha/beta fold hydrolase [Paenibacillus sp. OSY-SE]|uniref:alpha/beta fold hydrolase n=1 Tax=Paenibacillus sp. OSY-SE TaxID=1196323 RepID=UPI0002F6BF86|nr:alpha/beta hydrolase [Paenibacillus sp. OSY-SE]
MASFVLVHGAWDGGYVWKDAAALLRDAGHEVYVPTLTGLGERTHLAHPDVGLTTFIQDIAGVIQYEDLQDVILVGHSYSGMVISGVAERLPDRLKHLVFVDAVVPYDGESIASISGPHMAEQFPKDAQETGDGWKIHPRATSDWRKSPMTLLSFTEPVDINHPEAAHIPRTYIEVLDNPEQWPMTPVFRKSAQRAKDSGWRHVAAESGGHWVMQTQPQKVVHILNDCI